MRGTIKQVEATGKGFTKFNKELMMSQNAALNEIVPNGRPVEVHIMPGKASNKGVASVNNSMA